MLNMLSMGGGPVIRSPEDAVAVYWPIAFVIALALSFAVGSIVLTHLLGPRRHGAEKGTIYESGMNPITSTRKRFNVRYYLLAMTFLVFDVEIIFLYPWAATFRQIPVNSELSDVFIGRILFFLLASVIAYVYAWKKGVFRFV